ncbi:MAG: SUMF1/EgtB/PvdO family nonheme iron enzyme [Planctomycetes bacterium]|nr:SUMF1/EgtB/PvdO family nonheme iron enzyme [Planctomycetota bacterium]
MSKRNGDVVRRLAAAMLVAVAASRPLPAAVTFDWATVGNPGNAPDTLVMNKGPAADYTTGYGSVGYTYQISKYDVTNSQYVQFLNAVDTTGSNSLRLFNTKMSDPNANPSGLAYTGGIDRNLAAPSGAKYSVKTGQENAPAIWISWASGARFVNWLANGQNAGSTEGGVYDMSVLTGNSYATPPARASGAKVFLPSEDEYYKAAYYDPTKSGTGGYWQYGTRSDTAPSSVGPAGTSNSANIGAGTDGQSGGILAATMATTGSTFSASVNYVTNVGAYASAKSYYGLYDVDGLVYNWTEATRLSFGNQLPIYRGGSWRYNEGGSGAAYRNVYTGAGATSYAWYGFRVASLPAAAPGTTVNVASGTQTQTQAGYALFSGTAPLTKTGAGTLVVDQANTITGSTSVVGGRLQLANGAALASSRIVPLAGGTVTLTPYLQTTVGGLAPNAGGLTDVGSGMMTVAAGLSAADMLVALNAGRGDGSWNGSSGITSSQAAADLIASIPRTVGWLDNGDGSVSFAYAAPGDTNLDWNVDILDAANFLAGGKFDSGAPATWNEGDFGYDGVVDILDAADFLSTSLFDAGAYNPPTDSVAAVPEPSVGLFAAVAGAAFLCRRRTHRA